MKQIISAPSLLLAVLRIVLIALLLIVCLPPAVIWRIIGARRFWPRVFLGGVAWIAGLRITVKGAPAHNALFLPNHVSWLDIPAMALIAGGAFVAHDGLMASRVLRFLCDLNDTVFIARHRRAKVSEQAENIRRALYETGAISLFIEGTTGDGHTLLPFKSALLSAVEPLPDGVAVQPVLLWYGEAGAVVWPNGESGVANFLRIITRWEPLHLTMQFLAPLGGEALHNRKAMAAAAREELDAAICAMRNEAIPSAPKMR